MKSRNILGPILLGLFILLGPAPLALGGVWTFVEWREHRAEVEAIEQRRAAGWVDAYAVYTSCTDRDPHGQTQRLRYDWEGEWKDKDGNVHHIVGSAPACAPGMREAILANPANPGEHVRPSPWYVPVPLILCAIGFGFTFIGVKEWRKARRES